MVTHPSTNQGHNEICNFSPLQVPSDGSVAGGEEVKGQWNHSQHSTLFKNLSSAERSAIMQCPAAKNPDDLQLFSRLFPYFDGRHHLEEIMFYEDLRRSHLLELILKFKDVLVWVDHE